MMKILTNNLLSKQQEDFKNTTENLEANPHCWMRWQKKKMSSPKTSTNPAAMSDLSQKTFALLLRW